VFRITLHKSENFHVNLRIRAEAIHVPIWIHVLLARMQWKLEAIWTWFAFYIIIIYENMGNNDHGHEWGQIISEFNANVGIYGTFLTLDGCGGE